MIQRSRSCVTIGRFIDAFGEIAWSRIRPDVMLLFLFLKPATELTAFQKNLHCDGLMGF